MTAPIASRVVSTPCIGVCTLDPAGYCDGCLRTRDEIAAWSTMDEPRRRHVMDVVLPPRRAAREAGNRDDAAV